MSIRTLVEDARFLRNSNRNIGALALLLAAVGASSRVKYPKTVHPAPRSISKDSEAYKQFLGGRIGQMIGVVDPRDTLNASGFVIETHRSGLVERLMLEHIIYKEYRCALLHEGQLSGKARFVEEIAPHCIRYGMGDDRWFGIGWETDGTFLFDNGLLDLLDRAVSHARINAAEFGIEHPPQFIYELVNVPSDDEVKKRIVEVYGLQRGGWMATRSTIEALSRNGVDWSDKAATANLLGDLSRQNIIYGGTMTGLRFAEFVTNDNALTDLGYEVLTFAVSFYRLVQVA